MCLSVIIINDCREYLVEVELPLTADTEEAAAKRVGEVELVPIFLKSTLNITFLKSTLNITGAPCEYSRHSCCECVTVASQSVQ